MRARRLVLAAVSGLALIAGAPGAMAQEAEAAAPALCPFTSDIGELVKALYGGPDPDEDRKRAAREAFERARIAELMNEAGLFGETRALLADLYGDDLPPQAALTHARALRLQASDVTPPGLTDEASKIVAERSACLAVADRFLNKQIARLEKKVAAMGAPSGKRPNLSAESAVMLLGAFALELAETRLQHGDLLFSTAPEDFFGSTRVSADANAAMGEYRLARMSLAMAEGARPTSEREDRARARRAALADKLEERFAWYDQGLYFGGRAYFRNTPWIGLRSDGAQFALSGRLKEALDEMGAAQAALKGRIDTAREDIISRLKNLASIGTEEAQFRARMRSELFQEMTALEARAGTHEQEILKEMKKQNLALADLQAAYAESYQELQDRMRVAEEEAWASFDVFLTGVHAIAAIAPHDRIEEAWRETAASANASENGARPVMPASPDVLADFVTAEFGAELPLNSRRAEALAIAAAALSGAGGATEWQGLQDQIDSLVEERKRLEARLTLERAQQAVGLLTVEREEIEAEVAILQKQAEERLNTTLALLENTGGQITAEVEAEIAKSADALIDDAIDRVNEEIGRVEELVGQAYGVIEQVQSGARNVQAAAQAAQSIYAMLAPVPVSAGFTVGFERSTLVGLMESAVDLARFTIRSIQDVHTLKAKLAEFKGALNDYRDHLAQLNLESLKNEAEAALRAQIERLQGRAEDILNERLAEIREEGRKLADISDIRQRLRRRADEVSGARTLEFEHEVAQVRIRIDSLTARQQALNLRLRQALNALWGRGETLREHLARIRSLKALEIETATAFDVRKNKLLEASKKVIDFIESRRELQETRLAQVLLTLQRMSGARADAAGDDAARARAEADRDAAAQEVALGVDFSIARDLALGAVVPASAFGDVGIAAAYQRFDAAREDVARLLFDYANALVIVTQDHGDLRHGAYAHSHEAAQKAEKTMSEAFRAAVEAEFNVQTGFVALRITREDALRHGFVGMETGAPQPPLCMVQSRNPDAPKRRCLRIRIAPTPESLGLARPGSDEYEELSLSDILGADAVLGEARRFDPVNGALAASLFEAEAAATGSASGRFAASRFMTASAERELVFAPVATGGAHTAVLYDAFLAHGLGQGDAVLGMHTVGLSTQACGEALAPRLSADYPLGNQGRWSKASKLPYTPEKALIYVRDLRKWINDGAGAERSMNMLAALSMPEAYGRGLGNVFELWIQQDQDLPEEMHLILVYRLPACEPRAAAVSAGPAEGFKSNLDTRLEALRGAPLAQALARFEIALAALRRAQDAQGALKQARAAARAAPEDPQAAEALRAARKTAPAPDRLAAARLAVLDRAAALLGAWADPASTPREGLDLQAEKTLAAQWETAYAPILTALNRPVEADLFDVAEITRLETGLGAQIARPDPADAEAQFRYGAFRRPPPLSTYEHLPRMMLAARGASPSQLDGPLALQMRKELERAAALSDSMGEVAAFHRRARAMALGLARAVALGDLRLDWAAHLGTELSRQISGLKFHAALPQMLCAARIMEEEHFWLQRMKDPDLAALLEFEDWRARFNDSIAAADGGLADIVAACRTHIRME